MGYENDLELIHDCLKKRSRAQRALYDKYAGRMYAVCFRYAKNAEDAQDILQETFINVFNYLDRYKGEGSFEGWIRRIAVNCAIVHYRKAIKNLEKVSTDDPIKLPVVNNEIIDRLSAEELTKLIASMPTGYRLVFNLFAIEGYSHQEIAEQLGISESASRSQLTRARSYLAERIEPNVGHKQIVA